MRQITRQPIGRTELTGQASDTSAWFDAREKATTVDVTLILSLVTQLFQKEQKLYKI